MCMSCVVMSQHALDYNTVPADKDGKAKAADGAARPEPTARTRTAPLRQGNAAPAEG